MGRPKLTPQIAYNLAEALYNASGERDERLETVIAQHLVLAYLYARDTLKGPFPEGEPVIAQDSGWAYEYARNVLKGPWPEAEPVIAQNAFFAYGYARDILKSPWPEAELVIAQSRYLDVALHYAKMLKTPEDRARFREVQQWVAQS